MGSLRSYTYKEISKHNKADDCWLAIRDKVYDVTRFVPHHPGGNMIYLNAGRESTRLFESYHPSHVKQLLGRYCIGTVADTDTFRFDFAHDEADQQLYDRMKDRVLKHFRQKKIHPRISTGMYLKTIIILLGNMAAFYATHFMFENFWLSMLCAVMLGFFHAEVGMSIQHDANHGGYHPNPTVNKVVGMSLDLFGASSFIWKQQHVFGHHVHTNIVGIDPDIRVNDPDVRRNHQSQPWRPYHVYQHLYLGLLYGLLSLKSIFHDDISMLFSGWIGSVPVNHIHQEEKIVFFSGKLIYCLWYLFLPIVYSHHSFFTLLKLWLVAQLVCGWTLALFFQVNHVTKGASFYEKNGKKIPVGWVRSQIEGSSDFSHGSWFITQISGGLNYQVVHHLFPWVCHMHYPEIAPIVQDICKEEGINYIVFPSFFSALAAHFNLMKTVGAHQ